MLSTLMAVRRFEITIDQFMQLPRHPSYKYEYINGHALISPRMYGHTAVLDFRRYTPPDIAKSPFEIRVEPLSYSHWNALTELFIDAFERHPPFSDVTEQTRRTTTIACLRRTQEGLDGEIAHGASAVALDADGHPVGFAIVTFNSIEERKANRKWSAVRCVKKSPHLTWIAVTPLLARHGVGSRLLTHVVESLQSDGWDRLYSTFLDSNLAGVFWHWKRGFQILPIRVHLDDPIAHDGETPVDNANNSSAASADERA